MEGREHSGVIITNIATASPAEAKAFEERWRGRAAPTGHRVEHAAAFRVAAGYELDGASHVAIYESGAPDLSAAARDVGEGAGETTVAYTRIAEHGPLRAGRTQGVVLVFTDCDDPAAEDAYNTWYSGHLHHTVENMNLVAATRYVSNDPSRTPSKYLAIYETQSPDVAKVQRDGVDWWMQGGFEGPKGMLLRNEVAAERIDD